ncbi:MAG: alpha/beta hydrolase [Janthinobacterium lividum]
MDEQAWDPEMLAFQKDYTEAAARLPPIVFQRPFDPQRATNDALAMMNAQGGPAMADTADRWIPGRGRRILCRVHRPSLDPALPVLVYFHGGGWVWSSVDTHDRLTREYAEASGCAVVSVDYALSPEAVFPQAIEECAAVVRWIGEHGGDWGLDPTRIALGGDSAGGNLALGTALMLRDTGGPALRGILALYPVCDADFTRPSYKRFGPGGYFLTEEKMRFYWSVYAPEDATRRNPLAAPLHGDLAGLPPTLVQLAELDVLRDEGEALAAKLKASGVATTFEVVQGVIHGYLRASARVARARQAIRTGADWLRAALSV